MSKLNKEQIVKSLNWFNGRIDEISTWVYPFAEDESKRKFLRGELRKWVSMKKSEASFKQNELLGTDI